MLLLSLRGKDHLLDIPSDKLEAVHWELSSRIGEVFELREQFNLLVSDRQFGRIEDQEAVRLSAENGKNSQEAKARLNDYIIQLLETYETRPFEFVSVSRSLLDMDFR